MANTVNLDPRNIGYFSRRQDELARLIREHGYIPGLVNFPTNPSQTLTSLAFFRRYSTRLGRFLPLQEVVGELHYARYDGDTFVDRTPWELDVFGESNLNDLGSFAQKLENRYGVDVQLRLERNNPELKLGF